jgi:hypothetical protein
VVLGHLGYLIFVLAVQPADRLSTPPTLPNGVYGDQDLATMALRALNAEYGRTAGRTDVPQGIDEETYSRQLKEETQLQSRYYLEYPHANLVFFRLPWWLFGPVQHAPAALLDGSFGNLVDHQPQDESDRDIWRQFRRATSVYRIALFLLLAGLVLILARGYLPDGDLSSSCWLLLLPCGLYYTINRFDILPVFFTALALALLGRRQNVLSGMCLAAGFLSKVFPGLLLPLVVRYLWSRPGGRRMAALWLAGFTLTVLAAVLPPLIREGLAAVESPYQWQVNRPQFLWAAYGYILPPFLGGDALVARLFRTGSVLLTLTALTWQRIPDLPALVRFGGVLVVVFVLLQNVFSPQWILWFWPFLLPMIGRYPRLTVLIVTLDLATIAIWPFMPPSLALVSDGIQFIRLGAMIGIIAVLLKTPARSVASAVTAA